jgi:hypothetical protein
MSRTLEEMAQEIENLRRDNHRFVAQFQAAHEAINAERGMSPDKYSPGYLAGAREAAQRIAQAITKAREDFK